MGESIKKLIRCDSGEYIIVSDGKDLSHGYYTMVNTNDETRKFELEKLVCNGGYKETKRVKDKLFKGGFRDVIASTRLDDVFYSDGRIHPINRVKMDELTKDLDGHIFECDSKLVKYTVEDYVVKIIQYEKNK